MPALDTPSPARNAFPQSQMTTGVLQRPSVRAVNVPKSKFVTPVDGFRENTYQHGKISMVRRINDGPGFNAQTASALVKRPRQNDDFDDDADADADEEDDHDSYDEIPLPRVTANRLPRGGFGGDGVYLYGASDFRKKKSYDSCQCWRRSVQHHYDDTKVTERETDYIKVMRRSKNPRAHEVQHDDAVVHVSGFQKLPDVSYMCNDHISMTMLYGFMNYVEGAVHCMHLRPDQGYVFVSFTKKEYARRMIDVYSDHQSLRVGWANKHQKSKLIGRLVN